MREAGKLTDIALTKKLFMSAYLHRNAAGMASLYTMDGLIWPPSSHPVSGRKAIHDFWQSLMDIGIVSIDAEVSETDLILDTAIEISRFQLLDADQCKLDSGNRLVIWKLVDGHWRLSKDLFCSSGPAL